MPATSDARVSSTLTFTRSRKSAPASFNVRLRLRTTLPNCASKVGGNPRLSSKPGMPETNSRSPVRTANDSGGVLRPAGGAKCLLEAMEHLWLGRVSKGATMYHEPRKPGTGILSSHLFQVGPKRQDI